MAAENCQMEPGDTVAVWGCGPVAQFAIKSAWMLGAGRVIAIDTVEERLAMAASQGKAETINFEEASVYDRLMEMTKGRGPDRCIDAVGCEAHASSSLTAWMNKGLTLRSGQTHMQHYMKRLLKRIESNEIDPSFVITHRVKLKDAPDAYKTFRGKKMDALRSSCTRNAESEILFLAPYKSGTSEATRSFTAVKG